LKFEDVFYVLYLRYLQFYPCNQKLVSLTKKSIQAPTLQSNLPGKPRSVSSLESKRIIVRNRFYLSFSSPGKPSVSLEKRHRHATPSFMPLGSTFSAVFYLDQGVRALVGFALVRVFTLNT
jgi:hypothetical protein